MTTDVQQMEADAICDPSTTLSFDNRPAPIKRDVAEDVREIVEALAPSNTAVSAVVTLDLSNNTIGVEACEAIGVALRDRPELRHALWSDMFTGRSKAEIPAALRGLSAGVLHSGATLTELDVSDNAFGQNGVVGITDLLASTACYRLRILRMNNLGLGDAGCRDLTESLRRCLDASRAAGTPLQLRLFTAGRNRLENVGAGLLADVFADMGSLRSLALFQNGIGIHGLDGSESLARILTANTGLTYVDLNGNSIGEEGAKLVADALPALQQLRTLRVGDCLLKDGGCRDVASALGELANLEEIDLSRNEMRASGALSLGANVQKMSGLRTVNINGNNLGSRGVEQVQTFFKGIRMPGVLCSFSLDKSSDGDEAGDAKNYEASQNTGAVIGEGLDGGLFAGLGSGGGGGSQSAGISASASTTPSCGGVQKSSLFPPSRLPAGGQYSFKERLKTLPKASYQPSIAKELPKRRTLMHRRPPLPVNRLGGSTVPAGAASGNGGAENYEASENCEDFNLYRFKKTRKTY